MPKTCHNFFSYNTKLQKCLRGIKLNDPKKESCEKHEEDNPKIQLQDKIAIIAEEKRLKIQKEDTKKIYKTQEKPVRQQ